MSLIWTDSFDYLGTGTLPTGRYTAQNGPTGSTTVVRTGSASLNMWNATFSIYKLFTAHARMIIGTGFYLSTEASFSGTLISLVSNSVVVGELILNPLSKVFSYQRRDAGAATTSLGTSNSGLFVSSSWVFIEINVLIGSGTSGSVEVRLNGNTIINATSVNTQSTHSSAASGTVDGMIVGYTLNYTNGSGNGMATGLLDDLYVCNGAGTVNNTFLGDVRVEYLRPTGAGNSTVWTPVGAASNWDCVDELVSDGDTTYVTATGSGTKDLYQLGDLPTAPTTIHGIQTVQLVRKLSGGSASIKPVVRIGGTDYAGSAVSQSDTYTMNTEIMEVNPNTSTAWTKTTVDAMETGIEIA